jgi:polyisoprenoid-binding protein YceI
VLVGELRIRSVTRELRFPVRIDRPGPETIEISIRGSFDRNTFNVRGGFGSAAIGDEVGVRVDLVARRE